MSQLEIAKSSSAADAVLGGEGLSLSEKEFKAFRELIYDVAGISLSPVKRALVCARLSKRLRELGIGSFAEYYAYLISQGPGSDEYQAMINCITTNKTDFFREPHHFDFLREHVFPNLKERVRHGCPPRLRIWSAGCSTGEEPYTIAIALREHFGPLTGWDVRILASDIDTDVLGKAEAGLYALDRIEGIPEALKRRYFLRGSGEWNGYCRVRPELQQLITFRQVNLIETPWPMRAQFDLIFCRNVLIYFNRETQQKIVTGMAELLGEEGYLFLGHSENADWAPSHLFPLGNTIYRRQSHSDGKPPSHPNRLSHPHRDTPLLQTNAPCEPALSRSQTSVPKLRGNSSKITTSHSRSIEKHPRKRSPSDRVAALRATESGVIENRSIIVGEVFASSKPAEVATVLGSCIAVCLFDAESRVGGMNHFMLPADEGKSDNPGRYGGPSIQLLIDRVIQKGAERQRLHAKIFGGAHVLATSPAAEIGALNVRFARDYLAEQNIPILAERVGGTCPLAVRFLTHTGTALVRALEQEDPRPIMEREQLLFKELQQSAAALPTASAS